MQRQRCWALAQKNRLLGAWWTLLQLLQRLWMLFKCWVAQ